MSFREKIDKILKHNTLDLHVIEDLEAFCDLGAKTIRKNYNLNKEPSPRILVKMKKAIAVNDTWWDTGKGEIFDPELTAAIKSERADFSGSSLVQGYKEQIILLKQLMQMKDDEIARLKGQLGK